MTPRLMKEHDKVQLRRIHEEFYKEEFPFSHFDNFQASFTVEKDGRIVTAGGIRPLAEAIILTDKEFSTKERRAALHIMFQMQAFAAGKLGYSHLHAFVQDESWQHCLKKIGFREPKGNCLIVEV